MSASGTFRRLVGLGAFTSALLVVAVASPSLVGAILTGEAGKGREALTACFFLPTPADWLAHALSYALAILLAAGILVGASSLASQWYRTRLLVRSLLNVEAGAASPEQWACLDKLSAALSLRGRIDLAQRPDPVAFCYGWLKPRICVSAGMLARLDRQELQALLLHEQYHLLHRDPLKTAMSRVLAGAFFFLPLMRGLQQQYMVAKEIEADRHVINSQGSDRPLLRALYKLLLKQSNRASMEPATAHRAIVGSTDALNQRLDYLLNGRPPLGLHRHIFYLSSLALTGIGTAFMLTMWASVASALWYQAHSGLGGC